MSKHIIKGDLFGKKVCDALGLEADRVSRVVIDAPATGFVSVYVHCIGDERLLSADLLSGIQIEDEKEPA